MSRSGLKKIVLFLLIASFSLVLFACDKDVGKTAGSTNVLPDESALLGDIKYTVYFDSNGGSSVSPETAVAGETIRKPSDPTKEYYSFAGWYLDRLFAKKWDFANDEVTSTFTLYAKWTPKEKMVVHDDRVKLDLRKKTLSVTLPSDVSSFDLTGKIMLENDNYFFVVCSDKNCSEELFLSGKASFENLNYGQNTFYLKICNHDGTFVDSFSLSVYRIPVYTVRFFGRDNEELFSATKSEGETVTPPDYEPLGYFVTSWYDPDTEKQYDKRKNIEVKSDLTLYGNYEPAVYSISFNANGGQPVSQKINVSFGSKFVFPSTTAQGKYFLGWYTENGAEITGSNGVGIAAWHYTDVTTVYAKWGNIPYTITVTRSVDGVIDATFNNGNAEEKINTDSSSSVALNASHDFSKVNNDGSETVFYVFNGWYILSPDSFVTLSKTCVVSDLLGSVSYQQRWSTITVKNICRNDNEPVNAAVSASLDAVSTGKKMTIAALCDDYIHSFYSWNSSEKTDVILEITCTREPMILSCYWTEYSVVVNTGAMDGKDDFLWNISVSNDKNEAVLPIGNRYPVVSGKKYVFSATQATDNSYTFSGWKIGDETVEQKNVFSMTVIDDCELLPTFIPRPLVLDFDHAKADVTVNYHDNYCGTNFEINVSPYTNCYYAGAFSDEDYTERYTDSVIPVSAKNVYLKIIDLPVSVSVNMPGAGSITYFVNEKEAAYSSFGKKVSLVGTDYTDSLFMEAKTNNGYVWLGWYYRTNETDEWNLWTLQNVLDWKLVDKPYFFRATWKKIAESIQVKTQLVEYTDENKTAFTVSEINGTEYGTAGFNTVLQGNGTEYIYLNATINGGYIFEGWFVQESIFDIDNAETYSTGKELLLSCDICCNVNLSKTVGTYDFSTLTARYSPFDSDIMAFYKEKTTDNVTEDVMNDTPFVYEESLGKAIIYGFYCENTDNATKAEKPYVLRIELTVETYTTTGIVPTVFNHIAFAHSSKIIGQDTEGLISEKRTENKVIYTFDYDRLPKGNVNQDDGLTIPQQYKVIWETPDDNMITSLGNATPEGGNIGTFAYGDNVVFIAVPNNGYLFRYWEQVHRSTQGIVLATNKITESSFQMSGVYYDSFTAYFTPIGTLTESLKLTSNIEEAGTTFLSGYTIPDLYSDEETLHIDISAKTNDGYSFIGWFDEDDVLIHTSQDFSFETPSLADYFGANAHVLYTAKWREVSADVLFDFATDYSVTGYVDKDGATYFSVVPVTENGFSYRGKTIGYYNGYNFDGWFDENNKSYSADYFALNKISDVKDNYIASWSKFEYDIKTYVNDERFGTVTYAFYNDETTVNLVFHANPNPGYAFYGWYNADNSDNINNLKGYEQDYAILYSKNGLVSETFASYVSDGILSFCARFESISSAISVTASRLETMTVGTPSYYGVLSKEGTGISLQVYFEANPLNGFSFANLSYALTQNGSAADNGSSEDIHWVYKIEDFDETSTRLAVTFTYAKPSVTVINSSSESGDVYYYGLPDNSVTIEITPHSNYVFASIQKGGNILRFNDEGATWRIDANKLVVNIAQQETGSVYTVHWKSLWQICIDRIAVSEKIDDIFMEKTGYIQKITYKNGQSRAAETIRLSAEHADDLQFIGWYKKQVYDPNAEEILYEKLFSSHMSVYDTFLPEQNVDYFTRWGKYTILINNEEDIDINYKHSPTDFDTIDYKAKVSFDLNQSYLSGTNDYFISDIVLCELDYRDITFLNGLTENGYEYSDFDLNRGEGGKYLILAWKRSKSGIPITSLYLSDKDSAQAQETVVTVLSSDYKKSGKKANLNEKTGAEPLYLIYSTNINEGLPITEIGIVSDGKNLDFIGHYDFVGGTLQNVWYDKADVTPLSDKSETYLVFRRQMTAPAQTDLSSVQTQTVSLTNSLYFPTSCAFDGNAPQNTIFGGWYTSADCLTPFDFSDYVFADQTVYAKWFSLVDYDATSNDIITIDGKEKSLPVNNARLFFVGLYDHASYRLVIRQQDDLVSSHLVVYDVTTKNRVVFSTDVIGRGDQVFFINDILYGHLYQISMSTVSSETKGSFTAKLFGALSPEGGLFYNYLPIGYDFIAEAVTPIGETFTGWLDESEELKSISNELAVDDTIAPTDERYQKYTVYDKKIVIPRENITENQYLKPTKTFYSIDIVNTVSTQIGDISFSTDRFEVGTVVTLTASLRNLKYKFNGWYLFDAENGTTSSLPESTVNSETYRFDEILYRFVMIEESKTIVAKWESSAYTKYSVSYVMTTIDGNAPVNNVRNVTEFYYDEEDANTAVPITLYAPTRTQKSGEETGYYVFKGWQLATGEIVDFIDPTQASKICDRNNTITLTPLWGDVLCHVEILKDQDGSGYIYLGHYPQTRIDEDTSAIEYANINPNVSDDGYYYSLDASPKKYIRAEIDGKYVYFRFDPIRWNIVKTEYGKYTLQTQKVLFPYYFNLTSVANGNNWESSSVRNYLNTQFLSEKYLYFSKFEYNLIRQFATIVPNDISMGYPDFNDIYAYPWCMQGNTKDYMYLFSYKEIVDNQLGFLSKPTEDVSRRALLTDYAQYLGAKYIEIDGKKYAYYMLRSPADDSATVMIVDPYGKVLWDENVAYPFYGVRPVMQIFAETKEE